MPKRWQRQNPIPNAARGGAARLLALGSDLCSQRAYDRAITAFAQALALYRDLGRAQEALDHLGQALSIIREVGDRQGEGAILGVLSLVYDGLGSPQTALAHFGPALEISREVGNRREEGVALANLGLVHRRVGHPGEALKFFGQALTLFREVGDRCERGAPWATWARPTRASAVTLNPWTTSAKP